MIMADHPTLHNATHVAFDTPTAEQLLRMGASSVVLASDCLIIGPSRQSAEEHMRARETFWCSSEKFDRLYSSDVRWEPPVVLWASSSVHERVNLWRACSWLRRLGIACGDIFILEFEPLPPAGIPEEPMPPFDCSSSVSDHPDDVFLEHVDNAQSWPRERYERAIRLWDSYVDENPSPFVESCIRGVEGFSELAPLWALLSCFFPRNTTEGVLRLSRFDELLLTILSIEWQTPVAVFADKSQSGVELRQLLYCTGDLFLSRRLEQWASHSSSAFVERAPGPKPPNAGYPMLSEVYRLTERGMRLRDKGLDQLTDAPSLPIAGTEAYSASAPWVLLEDGRLARL
ncbi:hypothetical protein [Sorangium sp. So ce1024]|uniref:hypothetical protein n=1 Tax=Sorangium sp. So ce1024 TaxID=3133327 RepID=UPI003F10C5E9